MEKGGGFIVMMCENIERVLTVDLAELKNGMIDRPQTTICRYLWGPKGVGKSNLIKSWLKKTDKRKMQENQIYYFWLDLQDINYTGKYGYWEIWKNLITQFQKSIPEDAYEYDADTVEAVYELMGNSVEEITDEYDEDAEACINELFEAFTSAEIHIKIIMDNFEEVVRIFPKETDNGWFFMQLFELSPKGSLTEKNLSILLISDCYATKEMMHHMDYHSNFADGFRIIYLGGYSEKEMGMYYDALAEQIGELTYEQKARIEYYCGRHPKMLGIMFDMLTSAETGATLDVDIVFKHNGTNLQNYYDKLIQNLEKRNKIIEIESEEVLFEYGYLFKNFNPDEYQPLSEYFNEYLKKKN